MIFNSTMITVYNRWFNSCSCYTILTVYPFSQLILIFSHCFLTDSFNTLFSSLFNYLFLGSNKITISNFLKYMMVVVTHCLLVQ